MEAAAGCWVAEMAVGVTEAVMGAVMVDRKEEALMVVTEAAAKRVREADIRRVVLVAAEVEESVAEESVAVATVVDLAAAKEAAEMAAEMEEVAAAELEGSPCRLKP